MFPNHPSATFGQRSKSINHEATQYHMSSMLGTPSLGGQTVGGNMTAMGGSYLPEIRQLTSEREKDEGDSRLSNTHRDDILVRGE